MVLGVFKINLKQRDHYVFMGQSMEILNVFNALTLLKNENLFHKTRVAFSSWKN